MYIARHMNEKQVQHVVFYWVKTASHDYETMLSLFESKRYSDCLFFGHLVLEKILKALVVMATKKQAPFVHDLVRLQEVVKLNLAEEEVELLNKVNDFNIRSHYPDYKLQFYKTCTKKYTEEHLEKIIALYKNLCRNLKQKK